MRAVETISASVRAAGTAASGMWIVTGTTLSTRDQSIITGWAAPPQALASSPRNSVWPGKAKPAA